jgi:hypothetical protein
LLQVVDILKRDERFYPAFKRDALYVKLLAELGIAGGDARSQSPTASEDVASGVADTTTTSSSAGSSNLEAFANSALVTSENVKVFYFGSPYEIV